MMTFGKERYTMSLPAQTDPRWKNVIQLDRDYNFQFLATKILLGRLRLKYKQNQTPQTLENAATELYQFFSKNMNLPKAVNDLGEILGG